MATKSASRTSSSAGLLLVVVLVLAGLGAVAMKSGILAHAPTSAVAPTQKVGVKPTSKHSHKINLWVFWYTDDLSDARAQKEISIVWRLEGASGTGKPQTAIHDANRREWSLARQMHGANSFVYDGLSPAYVAATAPPGVELQCQIFVDDEVAANDRGQKVACTYPKPA